MKANRIATAVAALALSACAADRSISLKEGVLRWRDDGEEVALFGVNYYAPFYCDYSGLKAKGVDHRAA